MNSYYKANRNYREAYLKVKSKKLKKPDMTTKAGSPDRSQEEPAEVSEWDKEMEFMHYSEKYPANINYKDFMWYMVYPTFTYQDSYPLQKEPISPKKVFFRILLLFFAGVSFTHPIISIEPDL